MMPSNYAQAFHARMLAELAKAAKPECPQCHGAGVIHRGNSTIVCKCVATLELETDS